MQPFDPKVAISANNATMLNNLLPPVTDTATGSTPEFADPNAGSTSFVTIAAPNTNHVWEDDLLLTGVRSFDIKAYDDSAPLYNIPNPTRPEDIILYSAGYHDLGYGASSYAAGLYKPASSNFQGSTVDLPGYFQTTNQDGTSNPPQGFGHEGRIPPNFNDFRYHPRRYFYYNTAGNAVPYNIGDNSPGIIRLTRVWDSWSTDYTNAPDYDIFLNGISPTSLAIYPSFPPPYPSPLRGIQIVIRLTDPRGEKAKSITIRQDFTDKL